MAVKLDNIHYDFRHIDGYDKPINIVVAPREPGKTSMMWLKKIYLPWKKNHKPWIYLVRKTVEITEALVNSIADTIINKFTDDNVELDYTKGNFKDGIVDIKINDVLFFRIVSLSIDLRRIKLAVLKDVGGVFMDEFIIDPKTGEKYEKNEAFKLKEAYTTWRRECDGTLKMYFLGNPYSLYNPLFMWLNVPTNKIKKGAIITGDLYVLECYEITKELQEYILSVNPLYKFDDVYKKYAFDGEAINDSNIKLSNKPNGYYLRFIFKLENKYLGIYQNNYINDFKDIFYCEVITDPSEKRKVYCFEFEDLVNRCVIMSNEEKLRFNRFKIAMRRQEVCFKDINCYYLAKEIYQLI